MAAAQGRHRPDKGNSADPMTQCRPGDGVPCGVSAMSATLLMPGLKQLRLGRVATGFCGS
jgi:hypothetical protein